MVAQELPNLLAWVRFLHASPPDVAQLAERLFEAQKVLGAIPSVRT